MEANKSTVPNHCFPDTCKVTPTLSNQIKIPEQFHQIPLKVITCLHITFHSEIVHIKEARCQLHCDFKIKNLLFYNPVFVVLTIFYQLVSGILFTNVTAALSQLYQRVQVVNKSPVKLYCLYKFGS